MHARTAQFRRRTSIPNARLHSPHLQNASSGSGRTRAADIVTKVLPRHVREMLRIKRKPLFTFAESLVEAGNTEDDKARWVAEMLCAYCCPAAIALAVCPLTFMFVKIVKAHSWPVTASVCSTAGVQNVLVTSKIDLYLRLVLLQVTAALVGYYALKMCWRSANMLLCGRDSGDALETSVVATVPDVNLTKKRYYWLAAVGLLLVFSTYLGEILAAAGFVLWGSPTSMFTLSVASNASAVNETLRAFNPAWAYDAGVTCTPGTKVGAWIPIKVRREWGVARHRKDMRWFECGGGLWRSLWRQCLPVVACWLGLKCSTVSVRSG